MTNDDISCFLYQTGRQATGVARTALKPFLESQHELARCGGNCFPFRRDCPLNRRNLPFGKPALPVEVLLHGDLPGVPPRAHRGAGHRPLAARRRSRRSRRPPGRRSTPGRRTAPAARCSGRARRTSARERDGAGRTRPPMPKNANKALLVSSAEDAMATALESDENREMMAPGKATNAAVAHAQKSVDRSADTLTTPPPTDGRTCRPRSDAHRNKTPAASKPAPPGPIRPIQAKKSRARARPLIPSYSQRSRREDR